MGVPQIIYICLFAMGIGMEIVRHGKEKEGKHNATLTLISTAICATVLWWGGFWG